MERFKTESDRARRTVTYQVDGEVMGYYYEDGSDPGVFPIYVWFGDVDDFVLTDTVEDEEEAKSLLRSWNWPVVRRG